MKTAFFDVDTQIDFMFPAGALYVPGAESLLPTIVRLNRHALSQGWPLVSTMDAHSENDPEFRTWPPHCIVGTHGQSKPPMDIGIVFEKVTVDCFADRKLETLLQELNADRYVVYGVVTEICVAFAARGLMRLGKKVEIVGDAVKHLDTTARDRTLDEFVAGGGTVIASAAILR